MMSSLARYRTLWLLALVSLGAYGLLALWAPLLPYAAAVPSRDISDFAPWLWPALGYAGLLGLLFALYGLAYRETQRWPLPLGAILLPTAAFTLPLLLTYPFNATDIYRYYIRGRISAIYGQSPYLLPPQAFPDDPFLSLAGEWAVATSPYGPLWELLAATVARISGDHLLLAVILFKALTVLAYLGSGVLVWHLLANHEPVGRSGRTLLWAWNPALLLAFVVNGHNDALVLLWFLLALLVIRRGRPALGLSLMVLAPLTKPSGALPLPFFLLAALREQPSWRERLHLLLLVVATGLALTWLSFQPFGSPLELARRLLQEVGSGGGYSPLALLILVARRLGLNPSFRPLLQGAALLWLLATLWLLWRTWRGRSPLRGSADAYTGYLLQAFRFRIWYATWLFPWLLLDQPLSGPTGTIRRTTLATLGPEEAGSIDDQPVPEAASSVGSYRTRLDPDRRLDDRLRAGLWFLATTQFSVLIYGQLRMALWAGDHFWAHLVGVPFTFGLPLLLAVCRRPGADYLGLPSLHGFVGDSGSTDPKNRSEKCSKPRPFGRAQDRPRGEQAPGDGG